MPGFPLGGREPINIGLEPFPPPEQWEREMVGLARGQAAVVRILGGEQWSPVAGRRI